MFRQRVCSSKNFLDLSQVYELLLLSSVRGFSSHADGLFPLPLCFLWKAYDANFTSTLSQGVSCNMSFVNKVIERALHIPLRGCNHAPLMKKVSSSLAAASPQSVLTRHSDSYLQFIFLLSCVVALMVWE